MDLIDSHCHFDDPRFDPDRDAVLDRARSAGVSELVVPAVGRNNWDRVRAVCRATPGCYPAYGLHPWFDHEDADLERLDRWLAENPAVAIGECGLDHHIREPAPALQARWFAGQLELAASHGLPLIMHAVKAFDEVGAMIRRHPGVGGVVHAFTGSLQQGQRLIDSGLYLGIGTAATFPERKKLRRTIAGLPLDRLVLETDAPNQPGAAHRGERNEPAWITEVARAMAEIRDLPVAEVIEASNRNIRQLFDL